MQSKRYLKLVKWLEQKTEKALLPELPMVDCHHHLWEKYNPKHDESIPDNARTRKFFGEMHALNANYDIHEFAKDVLSSGHNITHTVYLQCGAYYDQTLPSHLQPLGETRHVQEIADSFHATNCCNTNVSFCAGIIGFVDLTLDHGLVKEALVEHMKCANFRGIRQAAAFVDKRKAEVFVAYRSPNLLQEARFRRNFALLEEYGLSYDCWVYHTQLEDLSDLAAAFPRTSIICNHVGTPLGVDSFGAADAQLEVLEQWKSDIRQLAANQNVVMKLGGLCMPVCGFGFDTFPSPPSSADIAKVIAPYISTCIEEFGVHRCMFESNFPVDKVGCSYNCLFNAYKRCVSDYSLQDQRALFHDNAVRIYNLNNKQKQEARI